MALGGRLACTEGGRLPGPMLLEKDWADMPFDDAEEGVLEDTEEEKEVLRAPARLVAFTVEPMSCELEGAPLVSLDDSPALSAKVLRTGITPFFPVPPQPSGARLPLHVFLFVVRLPIFLTVAVGYFLVLQWLPLGSLAKKALLWIILGVPGVWWVDLQIDGVRKGSLAKHHALRLPQPSDVIASSFTSPLDPLYLAAIFDPIFTASFPHTRQVQRISLFHAIMRAFQNPQEHPPSSAELVDVRSLLRDNVGRIVVVFPECTTTNGRGVLPLSPSMLAAPTGAKIFPLSLRYTPSDITTPVPGSYWTFLWDFLSRPTHCIRVRIAECVYNAPKLLSPPLSERSSYATNVLDSLHGEDSAMTSSTETLTSSLDESNAEEQTTDGRRVLDKVAEALARLGRVRRVGLGVRDKAAFVEVWSRHPHRRR
ncbi:MAG: hypothetical protein M1832_006029 [Thelocarpon impressellum]|nr:MAG: hypothetical protein M1832_006029 [Thelocarpon impressellum]